MALKILAINPGSTSTKLGIYEDDTPRHVQTLHHSAKKLAEFKRVYEQLEFRREAILGFLTESGMSLSDFDAFCGRGGLLKPIPGGVYAVSSAMKSHLRSAKYGEHASNLGAILADELGKKAGGKPAFIVNPVVVDEMQSLARYSGMPENPRVSIFHALNQKAVAQRYARSINRKYKELNLIVTHMGGGITVGAHHHGRVIDVNNGLAGDGPFSPERSGGVPTLKLIELCYSGFFEPATMKRKAAGKGGLVAYLRTNDAREIEEKIEKGDEKAREVYQAMAYQIAKEIGGMHTVLNCQTDAIILTGGLAHSKMLTDWIDEMVNKLAEIVIYPGEDELLAMVEGTLKAIHGETPIQTY
ncbi:MAG: butyrate kinase [Acidobacteria bacterium]|nr:MAG: butyrate kinase [Acidobacteriota bacterium]